MKFERSPIGEYSVVHFAADGKLCCTFLAHVSLNAAVDKHRDVLAGISEQTTAERIKVADAERYPHPQGFEW